MPDALTIAYIAMGAARRIRVATRPESTDGERAALDRLIDYMQGELRVIEHLIDFAERLDRLNDVLGKNSYVYAYEVCEEFGYYALDRMLKADRPTFVDLEEIAHLTIADARRG